MKATERLAKAKGYLGSYAFCLKSDLMRVNNARTLVDNALKDVKVLEKKLESYRIMFKDLKSDRFK